MKWIKEFKSFELNEGILDDIKSGFKKLTSKHRNINTEKDKNINTDVELRRMLKGRQPEKVSEREWNRKSSSFDRVPFTEEETNLFKQLNKKITIYKDFGGDSPYVDLETPDEYDTISIMLYKPIRKDVVIAKLDDNWYLISDSEPVISYPYEDNEGPHVKYYICDEWEEVLGYLSNII
jgi:hypothetical protein